ncbi:MAG: TIGR04211 family SH3 domain-containing protein [Xanthomonadaceae bacterium]|nr:TIGR04211 family SH3 domain-containing protein [Xanthomonadaceae bacterium]
MRSTDAWLALCASAIALMATAAAAEQMYVADKLVLNVYSEPSEDSESLATLETGDRVEMLEQLGNFMLVRLGDGREGWVGADYLTSEIPALLRLRALEKEQKAAAQKAEGALKAQIDELKKQNEALQGEIASLKAAASKAAAEVERQQQQAVEQARAEEAAARAKEGFGLAWLWAPFAILIGGAGYAAGYQTLARKIRNKFGGVKIY